MRIGVRRMRACLSLARRTTATERVEPLRVELRWLAQSLGAARDLDVFVTSTLPQFRQAVARGSGAALSAPLARLAARTTTRRKEAREQARAAVASPRFVRLVLSIAALAATPDAAGPSHEARVKRSAREVARPLLKRRHQALLALGTNLAHAAPEARHAARLAAKKLRYATEFFASLYPRKRTRAYRKALAALQEELGAWNDASVAARIAAQVMGAQSPAAAAFEGWAAARGADRSHALEESWTRFVKARPFWSHA
jgi:CHAD domain-containing protein